MSPSQEHVYKFLHTKYVDAMLAGNIRISKISVFRAMEQKEGAWIGDQLENTTAAYFDGVYEPEAVAAAIPPGRRNPLVTADGPLLLSNVAIGYIGPDVYIYSACWGKLGRLTKTMCDDAPYDRRNACVEIFNFPKLADIMFRFGQVTLIGKEVRMKELFSVVKQDYVTYQPMTPGGQPLVGASPFNKNELFKPQSETRIVFEPRVDSEIPEVLDVRIDKPEKFFRERFRNRPARSRPAVP